MLSGGVSSVPRVRVPGESLAVKMVNRSSAKAQIEKAFGKKKTLYEILEVAEDASKAQIRKAYFKLALTCHPDKCPGDPEATAKFQALSLVHATLSDDERRKLYDETKEIDEDGSELKQSEKEWYDYWRNLFPEVTLEDIEKFQGEYQHSEEERADVLKAYVEHNGKMDAVIDNVMLATDDDEPRFRDMIEAAIKAKEVKRLKGFKAAVKDNAKRKAKAAKEAAEAEELLRKIQGKRGGSAGASSSLATMAEHRKRETASFLDALEAKYGEGAAGGKKKKQKVQPPDEEEFARLQEKLLSKRG